MIPSGTRNMSRIMKLKWQDISREIAIQLEEKYPEDNLNSDLQIFTLGWIRTMINQKKT